MAEGRGKGIIGLGKGGAKRHFRNKIYKNTQLLTKGKLRRLKFKAGIVSGSCHLLDKVNEDGTNEMERILIKCIHLISGKNAKTIQFKDLNYVLSLNNNQIYGLE